MCFPAHLDVSSISFHLLAMHAAPKPTAPPAQPQHSKESGAAAPDPSAASVLREQPPPPVALHPYYAAGADAGTLSAFFQLLGCAEQTFVAAHSLLLRLSPAKWPCEQAMGCPHSQPWEQQQPPPQQQQQPHADQEGSYPGSLVDGIIRAALGQGSGSGSGSRSGSGSGSGGGSGRGRGSLFGSAAAVEEGGGGREAREALTRLLHQGESQPPGAHGPTTAAGGAGELNGAWTAEPFCTEWVLGLARAGGGGSEARAQRVGWGWGVGGVQGERGPRAEEAAHTAGLVQQAQQQQQQQQGKQRGHRMYVKALAHELRVATSIAADMSI
jgi:hypothetical protein